MIGCRPVGDDSTSKGVPIEHICVFRELLDRSPDGVVLFDGGGEVVYCNAALARMSGATRPEAVLPELSRDFYEDPDRDMPRIMERLRAEGSVKAFEVRVPETWSPVEWVEVSIQSLHMDGETHYLAVFRDVGPRKRLQQERERIIAVQQILNDAMLEGSLGDLLQSSCKRLADLYDADWAGVALLVRDEVGEHFRYQHTWNVPKEIEQTRIDATPSTNLTAYAAWRGHVAVRDYRDGSDEVPRIEALRPFVRSVEAVALRDRHGRLVGVLSLFADRPGAFTERENEISLRIVARELANLIEAKKLEEEIRLAGITDSVTELYNARHFYGRLAEEMERSRRSGRPLTVMLFDCDDFKTYNDRAGHVAGDHLLRAVADVVRRSLRSGSDTAFRYGGDEFVVLLAETDLDRARRVATRIRHRVRESNPDITVSVGLAEFRGDASPEDLVRRADRAMYKAKAAGKDRVVIDRPIQRRPSEPGSG